MQSQGRSLSITEERLWETGYGSDGIHLLFNIWYKQFDYTPAYENNLPQIDHIFPQSLLRSIRMVNPETNRKDKMRYTAAVRDQLANCMLLTKDENGFEGKCDTPPDIWFADKKRNTPEYRKMHLIPEDPYLWKVDNFEQFIEARKALIRARFGPILVSAKAAGA